MPPSTDQQPSVSVKGPLALVTGLSHLSYELGTLYHFGAGTQRFDKDSRIILPVFPAEPGLSQMRLMSPEQVQRFISAHFTPWLKGVDQERCVFVVPAKRIQARSTIMGTPGGGLVDNPQEVCLRTVFRELFPDALVYEHSSTESTIEVVRESSTDLTSCFLTLLDDALPSGRHFVVVPDFFSATLVASVPPDLLPEGSSIVIVHDNNLFYKLSDSPQALPPYKVLHESAEIQMSAQPFPDGVFVVALDDAGVVLGDKACTASKSRGVLRVADSRTAAILVFFPPEYDAAECMPREETLPWADALGPESTELTTNIASLVEKTQQVVHFLSETFPASEEDETAEEATTPTVSAQRIHDIIANQLCARLRTRFDDCTSSMTAGTQDMHRLVRPSGHSRRRGAGPTGYPTASRAASMV